VTAANRGNRFGLWGDDRGAVAPLIALGLLGLGGFAGLAVDGSYLYAIRTRLQGTADAAALAGARDLPNAVNARAAAVAAGAANMPPAGHGTVIKSSDVFVGNWNSATRVFTPGGAPLNAVRVIAKRAKANANPVPTTFATLFGITQVDVVVNAVATGSAPPNTCELNGIIAGHNVETGSNNNYVDAVCMYGRNLVKVGSDNTFGTGSSVGMLDTHNLVQGGNNIGLSAALFAGDMQPTLSQQVGSLIDDLQYHGKGMPSYINRTVTVNSLPNHLVPGTAYIVNGDVTISSDAQFHRVVIISNSIVQTGSKVTMTDVILASRTRIQLGSDLKLGRADYCSSGQGSVQLLSTENVLIGSKGTLNGVQIVAAQLADMGSNNETSLTGVTVQAGTDVKTGSNNQWTGCANNQSAHRRFGAGPKLRLVD
jgi:Flp pilus assembly protein TadG